MPFAIQGHLYATLLKIALMACFIMRKGEREELPSLTYGCSWFDYTAMMLAAHIFRAAFDMLAITCFSSLCAILILSLIFMLRRRIR